VPRLQEFSAKSLMKQAVNDAVIKNYLPDINT